MKIAMCFYGLAGRADNFQGTQNWIGAGENNLDCDVAYRHYKHHVFDKNDQIDIFFHTWSIEQENVLRDLYKPKDAIFQEQIDFDRPENFYDPKKDRKIWGAFSRWYSTQRSVELKKKYEEENNFIYDCVMLTRFDIAFMSDLVFKNYNMDNFYASGQKNPNHIHVISNEYISDWWFFSNSLAMDEFSQLYDNIHSLGPVGEWYDQHRMAKAKVIDMNIDHKLKYVLNRDDDNKLVRELLNDPQCKNRGNWWNYDSKTKRFATDKDLPISELNPGKRRHPQWRL